VRDFCVADGDAASTVFSCAVARFLISFVAVLAEGFLLVYEAARTFFSGARFFVLLVVIVSPLPIGLAYQNNFSPVNSEGK